MAADPAGVALWCVRCQRQDDAPRTHKVTPQQASHDAPALHTQCILSATDLYEATEKKEGTHVQLAVKTPAVPPSVPLVADDVWNKGVLCGTKVTNTREASAVHGVYNCVNVHAYRTH